jgi:DNA replication ATP-dependent helicase Dna2
LRFLSEEIEKEMNVNTAELARLYYLELSKIHDNPKWTPLARMEALAHLFEQFFLEITRTEKIQFTTFFARISYACHKFRVEKRTQYWVHFFRKKTRSAPAPEEAETIYHLGLKTFADLTETVFGQAPPKEILRFLPKKIPFVYQEIKVREFRKMARVLALEDDETNDRFLARDEENPSELIHIQYNIADRNEPFNPTIREIRQTFGFPVTLNLLVVEIVAGEPVGNKPGIPVYRPRAIVVEPDYLLDVSAVADCFQGSSAEPMLYLLKKFLPIEPTVAMMVGNIANFFLDELMHNREASFKDTFPKVFRINPLAFSLLPDATIREIFQTTQKHWTTLKNMVTVGMNKFGIAPADCYLEPSFYDPSHGLQGRLDVFLKNESKSAIIELKSGQPFMANRYGIGASHFIQTLLYDLMVRSVFGDQVEPMPYILYSGLETNQLRYAPPVKAEQNEALQLRNQLVALDRQLAAIAGDTSRAPLLEKIASHRFPALKGFNRQNIELFEKHYAALDDLERSYFNAFSGFIAREHQLAKTGIQGVDQANGLAALWLDTFEEKEAGFQLIKSLKIKENRANEEDPFIFFEKTPDTNPLANFRPGDIAVLYPVSPLQKENPYREAETLSIEHPLPPVPRPPSPVPRPPSPVPRQPSPVHRPPSTVHRPPSTVQTQIFKVTIISINREEVVVRLRYKQFNLLIFNEFEYWNLEHDQMDMGFTAMYQGLFRFAQSDVVRRQKLLTVRPPGQPQAFSIEKLPPALTEEQGRILQKMLAAQDYFLLWGPPGTGKTSQMLKEYVRWIFENTEENLLLLAYTNRAVDEICEALNELGEKVKAAYLRLGSRYATSEQFENQLLSKKTEAITTRAELKSVLESHRIFVSTLASLSNSQELLKLKKFRRVVLDEASQILEPALAGLLPQFEQFILIGDHKQLPAVVLQDSVASGVGEANLKAIGLQNLRNSLFERLYRRCCERGWHWAFDHLSHQGRMHEDIMRFPGEHFYEGKLQILPPAVPASLKQKAELSLSANGTTANWEKLVSQRRLVFLSTATDPHSPSRKTNRYEARMVAELLVFFQRQYLLNPKTIGVITPYRAQIAQIQEVLTEKGISFEGLTIDTVERYQGGARDIILISLCTNAPGQLDSLVSLSEEGVDRKLNVALTRAREHVVILGNEEILRLNETYRALMAFGAS